MRWLLHVGDILEIPADVLVCSANVYLNLSGGVGGAFAVRYGPAMQEGLHGHLVRIGVRFVGQGEVVEMPPCGSPYRAVLHAVAVDAFYDTSPEIVAAVLAEGLRRSAALGARSVAVAAVGTGYGRLSMGEFAKAFNSVIADEFPPLDRAVLGLRSPYDADELLALVPELQIG